MAIPTRIGYFGGSFDPVHVGHVRLALEVAQGGRLDEVRFLPAGDPPHKRGSLVASPTHRLAMLRRAIADHPGLAVDARELDRPGPSYTVVTMAEVAREEPSAALAFLIGMDSLRDLPSWYRIAELARLVVFLVAARPGEDSGRARAAADAVPGLRYELVSTTPTPLASRDVRRLLARGEGTAGLLAPEVAAYIAECGLYGGSQRDP